MPAAPDEPGPFFRCQRARAACRCGDKMLAMMGGSPKMRCDS